MFTTGGGIRGWSLVEGGGWLAGVGCEGLVTFVFCTEGVKAGSFGGRRVAAAKCWRRGTLIGMGCFG